MDFEDIPDIKKKVEVKNKKIIKDNIEIYGLRQPRVKMAHNQDYISIEESAFKNKDKNIGFLFPKGRTNEILFGTERQIENKINQLGGDEYYYKKYMKYKLKYLSLKD